MTTWTVKRKVGRYSEDYLMSWDIIWGPVWIGSQAMALKFSDNDKAHEAARTAIVCMKPVPWIVPMLGYSDVYVTASR